MRPHSYSYSGIFFGSLGIALFMLVMLTGGLWLTRPTANHKGIDLNPLKTAIFTIIPASSATITPPPTLVATPTIADGAIPSPQPGELSIGIFVQIVGTQGDGLRLREEPGLGNTVLTLVSDAEVFKVLDGPQSADGHTWWYLSDPYNENRRGWAVENYLALIQSP
jgi:hypothetical protein